MKTIVLLLGLICTSAAFAQAEDVVSMFDLDKLVPSTPPGLVLLQDAPATVERPDSVSDLMVSVMSHTDNLTQFPRGIGLEIAPYWLLGGAGLTYEGYAGGGDLVANIAQTLTLSVVTDPRETVTSLAPAISFSVLRGRLDDQFESYASQLSKLEDDLELIAESYGDVFRDLLANDPVIQALEQQLAEADADMIDGLVPVIEAALASREAAIKAEVEEGLRDQIALVAGLASALPVRRIGWKLDVTGGAAVVFPSDDKSGIALQRWGVWLTGGYEGAGMGVLGVARWVMGDYDTVAPTREDLGESGLEAGARVLWDVESAPLSLSVEGGIRWSPDAERNWDWRMAVLVDYLLGANTSATYSFGVDYEGNQAGTLVSMVNVILGVGSKRPAESASE